MSFNNLLKNNYKIDYIIQKDFIENKNLGLISSIEEVLSYESSIINYEEYKNKLIEKIKVNDRFEQLDLSQFKMTKELNELTLNEINLRTDNLITTYENYSQQIDFKKLSLKSKINELRQKLNSLMSFDNEVKFSIKENFYNLYNLTFKRVKKDSLSVDTEANVCTLPIQETKNIAIKNIYISNKSNGVPGNYRTGNNKLIYNIISPNEDTGFEFFKVGIGPLTLTLILELSNEEVVNELQIIKTINFINTNIKIKEVIYHSDKNGDINLKSLIDENYQNLSFDSVYGINELTIKHLPTFANSIKITFETNEFDVVDNVKVFSMFLQRIRLLRNQYLAEGELQSKKIKPPESILLASGKIDIYPKNETFDLDFSLSDSNGGSFEKLPLNKDYLSETKLFDNSSKEVIYKLNLKKHNDKFKSLNVYSDEEYFLEPKSFIRTFSKKFSPIEYSFNNKLSSKSLKLFQTSLISRSIENEKFVLLNEIENVGLNRIDLNINLNELRIDYNDLVIKINDEIWERVKTIEELNNDNDYKFYFIESNGKQIVINNTSNLKLTIKYSLKPLMPALSIKPEGYYIYLNESFDYSKETISLSSITNVNEKVIEILPISKGKHFLKNNYIDFNSFVIEEENNGNFQIVEPSRYTLDSINGILFFDNTSRVKISYRYYNKIEIHEDDYEIWVKDNNVKGLFIKPEKILINEINEKINNNNQSYYLFDGTYLENKSNIAADDLNNIFVLSNANVIKGSVFFNTNLFSNEEEVTEVDYINGYSEFLGLKIINKEFIPSIQLDNNYQITLTLKKKPYLLDNLTLEVYDSNENLIENTITTTNIENQRIVTISFSSDDFNLNQVLNNYFVKYFYQDKKNVDSQKYSINYKEGILYTSKELQNTDIDVTYNVGLVGVEYNLVEEINSFELINNNRTILLNTEKLKDYSNTIKGVWLNNKSKLDFNNLESYYSPLIYSIELGMK